MPQGWPRPRWKRDPLEVAPAPSLPLVPRHPYPPLAEPPLTISSSLQDSISCTYPGCPGSQTPPSRLPMGTRRSCEAALLPAQMRELLGHSWSQVWRPLSDRVLGTCRVWVPAPHPHLLHRDGHQEAAGKLGPLRTRASPGPAHVEAAAGTGAGTGGGQGRAQVWEWELAWRPDIFHVLDAGTKYS